MHIAVVGARGQLGAAVVQACASGHDVTAFAHGDLDITDDGAVEAAMVRTRPDVIVNAVAYNDVDAAEDRPVHALNVNAFGVCALARAASAIGATLVHYSTDFVFDGTATAPYTETDQPNPRSIYAASKLLGEWFAADAPRTYILRVESLFGHVPGAPAKGSAAGIMNKVLANEEARVFEDRTVTPSYVIDAARATRQLIERGPAPGIYHCVNSGPCTWLEFAQELARLLGVAAPRLVPTRMADTTLRAQRPQYCALSNQKLASVGIPMPTWQDALARYIQTTA